MAFVAQTCGMSAETWVDARPQLCAGMHVDTCKAMQSRNRVNLSSQRSLFRESETGAIISYDQELRR